MKARYAHTNLVARDWRALAAFYVEVFGCKPVMPRRDLKGAWVDALTGIEGARIRGIHLQLPGYGKNGPTLEVFQYSTQKRRSAPRTDLLGYGHIAFAVKDVGKMIEEIIGHGGSLVGERITARIAGAGQIDVAYARDPEGNIIEVQKWA